MFDHAPPHTYSPDVFDLLGHLVAWLASPGGNLLWDLFVAALSILITITVIQRYFERLEKRRWAPARARAYYRLFMRVHGMMSHIPYHRRGNLGRINYRFGSHHVGGFDYASLMSELQEMDVREYGSVVEYWASSPEQLAEFERSEERLSEPELEVFLAREPELGRRLSELRERILQTSAALKSYRRDALRGQSGHVVGSMYVDTMEQACLSLRRLVDATYDLNQWIIEQADSVGPSEP